MSIGCGAGGLTKSFAGPLPLRPKDQLDSEKPGGNRQQPNGERSSPDGGVVVSDLPCSERESCDETDPSNPTTKGGPDLAARRKFWTIHNQQRLPGSPLVVEDEAAHGGVYGHALAGELFRSLAGVEDGAELAVSGRCQRVIRLLGRAGTRVLTQHCELTGCHAVAPDRRV